MNDNVFTFYDVNEDTISKIIDTLPPKKSCGCDGISMMQLKYHKLYLLAPLTLIVSQIMHTGIFPDKLKIAKSIPIHKKTMKQYLIIIDKYLFYRRFPNLSKK